jgi:hypothetical protein
LIAPFELAVGYRDGPSSIDRGYCRPLWVIPAAGRIALSGGATFVIGDAGPRNRGLPSLEAWSPARAAARGSAAVVH